MIVSSEKQSLKQSGIMNEESILFSWGLFAQNASTSITNMWQDRYYTDVTLATMDDKQIKAHKLILSSSSNFFNNIFVKNLHPHPLIYLKDINHKELELVLKFIYHGKCDVDRSDIEHFLAAGSQLGVSGLVKEETRENIQFHKPFTSHSQAIHISKEQEAHLSNISRTSDSNSVKYPADTDRKYKHFDHPLESTDLIDHRNEKDGFETGEVYDFTPAHIEGKVNEQKHKCYKCDYTATNKGNLTKHNGSEHGALTFKCNQCSYEGSQDKYLTLHKESRHQGIMYKCDKCDFIGARKNTLNHHKKVRHEGKWKKCENCDYKAATRNSLNMHILSKHKGIRYFCDQCDHVATQEQNLKVHKKRHEANEALFSKSLQYNEDNVTN